MTAVPADGGPFVFVTDLDDPVLMSDDHHHLARARRVRDGDSIVVGDGAGRWAPAVMRGDRPEVVDEIEMAARLEPEVSVGFALMKGSKPELVVQKLTELGVDHIRPFLAGRSVVRWDQDKIEAAALRWERVAREAAMQSRRSRLPVVHRVATFVEAAALAGACRADRDGGPISLTHPLVLIGPEGGWDDHERTMLLPTVGLGPNVLRAETAAIAAATLLAATRFRTSTSGRADEPASKDLSG